MQYRSGCSKWIQLRDIQLFKDMIMISNDYYDINVEVQIAHCIHRMHPVDTVVFVGVHRRSV